MLGSVKKYFLILCCWPGICHGQNLFEVGVGLPLYLKVNTDFGNKLNNNPIGSTGLDATIKINGRTETSISFQQILGITYDRIYFRPEEGTTLFTERLLFNINPSVMIPSKWQNMKYNIGLGVLLNLGESVSTSTNSSATVGVFNGVDSIQKQLLENSASIIPFITIGAVWEIKKHIRVQVSAEQTLLNFYRHGAEITYQQGYYQYVTIPVSYQPLYLGVRLFYFF